MHLPHCPATPPWGCGYWNLCNAPLHCLGAVGGATPAIHCLTASGQWAVELLQGGLGGGSSAALCCAVVYRAVPCCVVLCCALLCCHVLCCAALCCAVLCCAVPCRAVPCRAVLCCALVCCAVLCCGVPKALLPNGKRPGYLPKGKGKLAMHRALPGGSGQWNSCNAPPHCLGAVANWGCYHLLEPGTLP